MVRLKLLLRIELQNYILFQFHYGSIKAEYQKQNSEDFIIISIPLWFD